MTLRRTRRELLLGGLVLATVAAATVAPGSAQPFLKFSLGSRIDGPAAPYLVALDRGYLKDEGLEVAIDPAAGAQEALTRVASGSYELGVVDINALVRFRDLNPDAAMPAVFMVFNRPPFAILARRSRSVTGPRDLEGKRVGASEADNSLALLRIFARLNGIDPARLRVDSVGLAVREPMLAAGQVDAVSTSAFAYVDLIGRGVPADDIVRLMMADYGVQLYGDAIFVHPRLAAERPEVVRAFLRGILRGLRDTVRDPARAIDAVVKRIGADEPGRAAELQRLRIAVQENIVSPEVAANGFGAVDPVRLEKALDQLAIGFEFRARPKASAIFDPAFLPDITARRLH